jgi:Outer membrane lipoprotein-sorting protein
MKLLITCALLFAFTSGVFCQTAEQQGIRAEDVINRMYARDAQREALSRGYVGTRRYTLENERMHKTAELVAAVHCDPDGTKHFEVVSEAGWGSANKHVLRKMLESETETSSPSNRAKSRLIPDNYDFSLVGTEIVEGRSTYVIDVVPKRRDKYLMEGRIWVDETDYVLVRAEGKPAHNPSFWTHSVHFVQQYQKRGDFWFPVSTESISEARIFGATHVNIAYSDYAPNVSDSASQHASRTEMTYATYQNTHE